jgi:hypothetical protein
LSVYVSLCRLAYSQTLLEHILEVSCKKVLLAFRFYLCE